MFNNVYCYIFHKLYDSEHYNGSTIGFLGLENKHLEYSFNILSLPEAEILQNMYLTAVILYVQNGGLNDVCANANIGFWIP